MNLKKTIIMCNNQIENQIALAKVNDTTIENVEEYVNLRLLIHHSGFPEIKGRIKQHDRHLEETPLYSNT